LSALLKRLLRRITPARRRRECFSATAFAIGMNMASSYPGVDRERTRALDVRGERRRTPEKVSSARSTSERQAAALDLERIGSTSREEQERLRGELSGRKSHHDRS
jgi:hypothetical protein